MDRIEEFINRRFSIDCDWLNGNCYFFALILKSVFSGVIVYDHIDGHFLLRTDGGYYDWTGRRTYSDSQIMNFVDWEMYYNQDPKHWNRIARDCIL